MHIFWIITESFAWPGAFITFLVVFVQWFFFFFFLIYVGPLLSNTFFRPRAITQISNETAKLNHFCWWVCVLNFNSWESQSIKKKRIIWCHSSIVLTYSQKHSHHDYSLQKYVMSVTNNYAVELFCINIYCNFFCCLYMYLSSVCPHFMTLFLFILISLIIHLFLFNFVFNF